jgi:hypothetical protein
LARWELRISRASRILTCDLIDLWQPNCQARAVRLTAQDKAGAERIAKSSCPARDRMALPTRIASREPALRSEE